MTSPLQVAPVVLVLLGLAPLAPGAEANAQPREEATGSSEVTAARARGYADAILGQVFQLRDYDVAVRGEGEELVVTLTDAGSLEVDKIARALLRAPGIRRVVVRDDGEVVAEAQRDGEEAAADEGWDAFPGQELFAPLLADPRWPEFSASYQHYLSDSELGNVAATSFGESFALLRSPRTRAGEFELGLQAGVFSVFDLDADSFDLVNSDFLVGGTLTHRLGEVTTLLRLYHQSSHLGDEYLLRNRVDRVNLSYEVVDLLLSYTPFGWLRVYGGGGWIVHRNPDDLDRGLTQAGLELSSPVAFAAGHLRPMAGLDLQFREESDWRTDLSTRFGLQIEHPTLRRLRVRIFGEYYRGRSPNGQFYRRRIETLGVGIHLGF